MGLHMGILNRHRDSPRQFLLFLDHFIDTIECVNVFVHGMANLAVLGTSPSCSSAAELTNLHTDELLLTIQ